MATESFSPSALAEARERRKWTHQQLSSACRVSLTTVKNWEAGTSQPNAKYLGKIARALGVKVADLFAGGK